MSVHATRRRSHWRISLRAFAGRPRLLISALIGLVVAIGAAVFAPGLRATACAVAGWDAFCVVFMTLVLLTLAGAHPDQIRARAAQDEGQAMILALVLVACVASVAAVAMELALARTEHGLGRALHITVAFVTVTASWLVTQTIFAVHYAHEYYTADPDTGDEGGLGFPGGQPPDYWDFLHFSMIIGVAAQTADVTFTQKRLRRLGTLHSLIAFAFNTLIVALTINLVAGLF